MIMAIIIMTVIILNAPYVPEETEKLPKIDPNFWLGVEKEYKKN